MLCVVPCSWSTERSCFPVHRARIAVAAVEAVAGPVSIDTSRLLCRCSTTYRSAIVSWRRLAILSGRRALLIVLWWGRALLIAILRWLRGILLLRWILLRRRVAIVTIAAAILRRRRSLLVVVALAGEERHDE